MGDPRVVIQQPVRKLSNLESWLYIYIYHKGESGKVEGKKKIENLLVTLLEIFSSN